MFGSGDGQQFGVQLSGPRGIFLRWRSRFIFNHKNFALQECTILIHGDDFETVAALGDQVEASIGILFHDGDDFGGASHFGETLIESTNHSKNPILRQTFGDHFFIARLENVQRQWSAGKQDDIEREQGNEGRHKLDLQNGSAF